MAKTSTIGIAALAAQKIGVTMPTRPSSVRTTGNWKTTPKAKINVMISDRYSLTRGSSSICARPGCAACCMPMKKVSRLGITTK